MSIISLYYIGFVPLPLYQQTESNGQNQNTNIDRYTAFCIGRGFPQRLLPLFAYALSCRAFEIKRSFKPRDWATNGDVTYISQFMGETFRTIWYQWVAYPFGAWSQTYHEFLGRSSCPQGYRAGQTKREQSQGKLAECNRKRSERLDLQTFFISIGARYKRIRKRPREIPSPQLYEYKTEKLQELEQLERGGKINLYFADESHVCTEGYVPYGWQFRDEDVYIPSLKADRLNLFGMIDRNNRYDGFCTTESIDADKVIDFLDRLSLKVEKDTFIVLDNSSVHRNRKIKELRNLWEKRGLYLFYLPPYSPQLNIAEILWRILKGKWIRPQDYISKDTLFYTVNRALADIGKGVSINFKHCAA
jgi:transposase